MCLHPSILIATALTFVTHKESHRRTLFDQSRCISELLIITPPAGNDRSLCSPSKICDVDGTECKDGILVGVTWKRSSSITLKNLDWFPPTMQRIHLFKQFAGVNIHTRRLPRELRYFRVHGCQIHGTIALQGLPVEVLEVHLRQNMLTGEVSLLRLPSKLRVIDLGKTNISKVIFDSDALPIGLREVHVYPTNGSAHAKNISKRKLRFERLFLHDVGRTPSLGWSEKRQNKAVPSDRRRSV